LNQRYEEGAERRRSAWVAGLLSLITPGLGLLYCGKVHWSMMVLIAAILPWLISAFVGNPAIKMLLFFLYLVVHFAQIIWSMLLAISIGDDYRLQRFNRFVVYALFFMIFAAYNQFDTGYLTEFAAVSSESMAPLLSRADMVIVNKLAYHSGQPAVGEAVLYQAAPQAAFCGRIIAAPGDRIEMKHGQYLINGTASDLIAPLDLEGRTPTSTRMVEFPELKLDADEYFVTGDNLAAAYDSRFLGAIRQTRIIGRVDAILYSTSTKAPGFNTYLHRGSD
jgi:signal peptidase I